MKKDPNLDVLAFMRALAPSEEKAAELLTLREWNERYLDIYCNGIKATTKEAYMCNIKNHIDRVLGNQLVSKITAEDIQLFLNSLALGIGLEKPLSSKSIKNIHGILHKSLDIAEANGYIVSNPAQRTSLPKIIKHDMHALSVEETKRFLFAIKGNEKECLYITAIFTGMRAGELIGLTWDCVNFNESCITLYRQLVRIRDSSGKYHYCFSSLKSNRARRIFPPSIVLNLLSKLKDESRSDFVFVNARNSHHTHSSLNSSLKKVLVRAGITNFRFHDLRHTFATISIRSEVDTLTLKENMGHYSAAFTLDVYGHCDRKMKQEGAGKLDKFIADNFGSCIL